MPGASLANDFQQPLGGCSSDTAQAFFAEALLAVDAKTFDRALELLDLVISLDPTHADALYKRGNVLKNLGRLHDAVASYDKAIEQRPGFAYAFCNRGVTQQSLEMYAEALASYESAISLDPIDALSHFNRAVLLQEFGSWDEAIVSYDRAISINPSFVDAQYNRSLALLYCGDLEQGWQSYEWRWENAGRLGMGEARDFTQPLWLGEHSLSGKRLLLHSEGGLGDTIQFSRYASVAAERGATVYLELQPALHKLLSGLEGVVEIIDSGSALPAFDCHCPLMSLPLAFKTKVGTIPPPAKPLHIDKTKHTRWESLKTETGGPRVGLAWSGNPHNPNDRRRSVRLADWMLHLPTGYRYFRLQKDLRDEDRAALACSEISSNDADVQDFLHIAALCKCMDIVISVDTSIAHLSATLGCATWVMLPHIPDWRWLRGRQDSPWYPTMRLFQQDSSESWSDVFERVSSSLQHEFPLE